MSRNTLGHRPAVLAALAFSAGIVWANYFETRSEIVLLTIVLVLIVVAICFWRWKVFVAVTGSIALFILGFVSANNWGGNLTNSPLSHLASLRPVSIVSVGVLDETRDARSGQEWIVTLDSLGIAGERVLAYSGRLLLFVPADVSASLKAQAGSRVRLFSSLEPYKKPSNPHEFGVDLKRQIDTRTDAHGELHSRFDYYLLTPPSPSILEDIANFIGTLRSGIVRQLDIAIRDSVSRAFVKAVVLGERTDMSQETLSDFTVAGVSHILAVSGFNVAIVALVTAQLLRLLGMYWRRPRIILSALIVLLYCAIVGFQPSVVRALIMIELVYLARWLERKPDSLNIVCSAICLSLLARPTDLFDVGFQLSYAAVLGLVVIAPELQRLFFREDKSELAPWNRRLHHSFYEPLILSLSATLASMPVIVMHFYRVSFVGLAANVPIIPLAALITVLGFLLIPLTAIYQPLGQLYGDATDWITKLLLKITSISAHLPAASHSAPLPSTLLVILFCIGLCYIIYAPNGKRALARGTIVLGALFVLVLWKTPLIASVLTSDGNTLQVLFFDVGQGDCILIHTPHGKNYMVDFGTVSQSGTAVADRVVVPFLRAENESTIDAGFISHMHRDHYGGAPAVMRSCTFQAIASGGERTEGVLARQIDSLAIVHHVHREILSRGDRLDLDSNVSLYVLYPDREKFHSNSTRESVNNGSLVFKLVYHNTSLLLLGDIERSEEESLLGRYGQFLQSSVVKVAHHGSLTSSSHEFIDAVRPQYAVISVGERNRYGHPAPAIVRRWMDAGSRVLRTDKAGAVLLVSDGNAFRNVNWR